MARGWVDDAARYPTRVVISEEADGFLAAHPRMQGSFLRRSRGTSETRVTAVSSGAVRTTTTHFGFPVLGELELRDDCVGCGVITRNGAPLRWHGNEGRVGEAVLFPPGSRVPVSLPDETTVRTISAPMDVIQRAADDLGSPLASMSANVIAGPTIERLLDRSQLHQTVGRADQYVDDEILLAFVQALSAPEERIGTRARAASVKVVADVIDFLAASGEWKLSTLRMCRLTNVSERRLQLAFHDVYGVSPTAFLRERALSASRDALLGANARETSVTDVALDHGFHHMSRFAAAYRAAYGELPSRTLARTG